MKEPLYLIYDSKDAIPVPLEYWTIIYDPESNEAISFLGNNNPHSKDIQTYKCENICKSINWVKNLWDDFDDETKGHVTCCSVKGLAEYIKYVKELKGRNGKYIWKSSVMAEFMVCKRYKNLENIVRRYYHCFCNYLDYLYTFTF